MPARPQLVYSTSQATNACSANAAPTTRSRIARRFDDNRTAMPRMTTIPATPSSLLFMESPARRLPDHAIRSGCGGFVQQFERFLGRRGNEQLAATLGRKEALGGRLVDEFDEAVPEAFDVEQAERLLVVAERVPAPRLEEFVERSDPTRKREERVGKLGHPRLALVHRLDDVKLGDAGMRDLDVDERLRDDSVDLAAELEHAIGDQPHEAEPAAAVDQLDALADHGRGGRSRGVGEHRVVARRRAAI